MKQSFKTKLKQLWFPAAFRLPEPEYSEDQLDTLEELISLIHPSLSRLESASKDDRIHLAHFLVDLGTGIWRIRRKIEGMSRMPKEIKDALYALESTWTSMSEGGVEIIDHLGTIPAKTEAKVIEVRDIPNLVREQVIETVKPTILLRGEIIQLGEVIMGRPAKPGADDDEEPPTAPVVTEPELESAEPQEPELVDEPVISHQVETLTMEAPQEPAADPISEENKEEEEEETETEAVPQPEPAEQKLPTDAEVIEVAMDLPPEEPEVSEPIAEKAESALREDDEPSAPQEEPVLEVSPTEPETVPDALIEEILSKKEAAEETKPVAEETADKISGQEPPSANGQKQRTLIENEAAETEETPEPPKPKRRRPPRKPAGAAIAEAISNGTATNGTTVNGAATNGVKAEEIAAKPEEAPEAAEPAKKPRRTRRKKTTEVEDVG